MSVFKLLVVALATALVMYEERVAKAAQALALVLLIWFLARAVGLVGA